MSPDRRSLLRVTIIVAMASIGVALVGVALVANHAWFDRHFLPSFFLPRRWYELIHLVLRATMTIAGVAFVLAARPLAARLIARTERLPWPIVIAAALALGASEVVLRRVHLRPAGWLLPEEEPRREPDPRLGWTLVPSRTGHSAIGGRIVDYTLDSAGYRIRVPGEPVDPDRPTILFTGESMMFGEGLTWEETVPAQAGAMMNLQSANLAVHGYSTDQAYLRLEQELPRFRRPIAVVSLFMPALFGRNLDDDRPRLGPGLVWMPTVEHARLVSLAGLLVPYRRDHTVELGITVTREVLRATVALALARAADCLLIVPQFGAEDHVEQVLRRRILDETGLPYALVEIDGSWRLPWDRHPNAQAARAIADAVASRLRSRATVDASARGASSPRKGPSPPVRLR